MCQSWEPPVELRLPTALHPLQCNDPYAKKGLLPVVYTNCDCHLGFNLLSVLLWNTWTCLFLKSLLNCMQSNLLFVFLHVFCTSLRMILFLVSISHSQHQADFLYNPASVHSTRDSRLFYGYSHASPPYRPYHLKDQKLVV